MKSQVVIVGAGPAGVMAAFEAVKYGCHVTLIDESPRIGGQIYRQAANGIAKRTNIVQKEQDRKKILMAAFEQISDRIDFLPEATAYAAFPGPELHVTQHNHSFVFQPKVLILATGVSEYTVPFSGWTLPGVMFAGGVQALMKEYGVCAGKQALVAGAGPLSIAVGAQLVEANAKVQAIALLNPLSDMTAKPFSLWAGRQMIREGFTYLKKLKRSGVPTLNRWRVIRAHGKDCLKAVTLGKMIRNGQAVPNTEKTIQCDLLAVNYGFSSNSELARMFGIEVVFNPEFGGWIPQLDVFGGTTAKGVLIAGDCGGVLGGVAAAARGSIAGATAAKKFCGKAVDQTTLTAAFAELKRHQLFQKAVRKTLHIPFEVYELLDPETHICRCEGVSLERLQQSIDEGHHTINAIKRNTRAGMGRCGGRVCLRSVAALLNEKRKLTEIEPMTARPVARPVTLGSIANQSNCEGQG